VVREWAPLRNTLKAWKLITRDTAPGNLKNTLKAWKLVAGGNAPGSLTNMSDPERVAPQEKTLE
jgi:hypothetical protein